MDLHPDTTPGLGLPQPSPQEGSAVPGVEVRPIAMDVRQSASGPSSGQSVPVVPVASAGGLSDTSAAGDDNLDALDEEWVNKAKAIVERTKSDPYLESNEISKAKADYLRLRYNKQIKVADERS